MASETNIVNVTLPNASIRLLSPDGTLTLPWRKFFQDIFLRTGGSSDSGNTAALLAQLGIISAESALAKFQSNSAITLANEALSLSEQSILLDSLVFESANNDRTYTTTLTDILAYTSLDSNSFIELNNNNNTYYGSWYDTTTQSIANTSLAYPVNISSTVYSDGISKANDNTFVFNYTGTYNMQFSIQLFNSGAGDTHDARVWFQQNDIDIPYSNSIIAVPPKHGTINGAIVLTVNMIINAKAGDTTRLMWSAADTVVFIGTIAAETNPARPSSPGVILTITPVA